MSKSADLDIDRIEGVMNEADAESQADRDAEERAQNKEDAATDQFIEDSAFGLV